MSKKVAFFLLKGHEPSISSKEGESQEEVRLSDVIKLPEFSFLSTHCDFRSWWCQRAGIPGRVVYLISLGGIVWVSFSLQDVVQSFLHGGFLMFHLSWLCCLPFLLSWINTTVPDSIHSENSYWYSSWLFISAGVNMTQARVPRRNYAFLQLLHQCS